ncbi:MAG TPA: sulfotransferase family 2 domain-containing protein [Steroidobacteraceae bacterium]|nr:sulfotransferase family 2 domain-containing protein [Steroidobacteraceae bacterium]
MRELAGSRNRPTPRPNMTYRNLIFLHIPKAAGTTLHSVLEKHYAPASQLSIYDPEQADRVLPQWPVERRETIRLLKGHVAFGLHQYLVGETAYITFVRDPVDRIVSHYYYVRRMPSHYLYQQVMGRNMSLADYAAARLSDELDNGQVRMLAGILSAEQVPIGTCDAGLLELAKKNIAGHFAVAGVTERFDESLALMALLLGWDWVPSYKHLNVSDNRPGKGQIDAAARDSIERANPLDCELYGWARDRLERLLDEHREQVTRMVAKIQAANHLEQTGT